MGTDLMHDTIFVGMDVQKATISVGVADGARGGGVRHLGNFLNRADRAGKLIERLSTTGSQRLRFCYEAGPCGYGLYQRSWRATDVSPVGHSDGCDPVWVCDELLPSLACDVDDRGYFGFCQTPRSPHKPRSVDPSKIACVSLAAMANQAKPLRRVTPSRRSKVPSGGRGWFTNRVMAHVRTPGGPTSPTQRLFRDARSSPNLCARPSLKRFPGN